MIYQCSPKGHRFLWVNIVTEHTVKEAHILLDPKANDKISFPLIDRDHVVENWFEVTSHRCPVEGCGSIEISEYIEPAEVVESLVSVPHSEVNAKIAEGYQVKSIYVKETVLVKVKKP